MDNYLDRNCFLSFYTTNALKEAQALKNTAQQAAFKYLKDSYIREKFIREIEIFIQSQLDSIKNGKSERVCRDSLDNLRQEKTFIDRQTWSLLGCDAKIVASGEIVKELDSWGYIINGVGVVLGGFQIVAGVGIALASAPMGNIVGIGAGALLMLHGLNAMQEGALNIASSRNDNEGFLKRGYIDTAKFIGFDAKTGSMAYSSMDLALSGYGLARSVLKPNAYRLFTFIPSDFVRRYKNISAPALTIEVIGDAFSVRSAINAEN